MEPSLSSFMEYIWTPVLALFWYFINRLQGKIDEIEKNRATNSNLGRISDYARELEKRIEVLSNTALSRVEIQRANEKLHERLNEVVTEIGRLERNKADRIKLVSVQKE